MGSSLGDIIKNRGYSEPPEIAVIKAFVKEQVGMEPKVAVTRELFIISLPSAAAIGTLRFKLFQLQRQLGHSRKIILKIT